RVAGALNLDGRFVVPLYRLWMERDAETALAELASITPPATRRAVALAMHAALGGDDSAGERGAAELSPMERASFRADVLVARAERDGAGVLAEVTSGTSSVMQSVLLPRIVAAVADKDPEGAI